ncbi:Asparaginyl-tRNA synthetase, cytoplasmic (Asparagine--tRNA ligase) (AsnRS) [Balamuthia mandrillaris]
MFVTFCIKQILFLKLIFVIFEECKAKRTSQWQKNCKTEEIYGVAPVVNYQDPRVDKRKPLSPKPQLKPNPRYQKTQATDYITVEPFVPNVGDIRIQKVGNNVRAFKRMAAGWKGNVGLATVEDIPVTETYQLWVDECSKIFGGLDILSIDAVIDEAGKHTILEVNDTATGLNPDHEEEDTAHIRDLVLQKMKEAYQSSSAASSST